MGGFLLYRIHTSIQLLAGMKNGQYCPLFSKTDTTGKALYIPIVIKNMHSFFIKTNLDLTLKRDLTALSGIRLICAYLKHMGLY